MEEVCERENLKAALRQVRANQRSPGVDGMTLVGLKDHLKQHWPARWERLLNGTYEQQPVRRVEMPRRMGEGAQARHFLCAGLLHSAGGAAGSA